MGGGQISNLSLQIGIHSAAIEYAFGIEARFQPLVKFQQRIAERMIDLACAITMAIERRVSTHLACGSADLLAGCVAFEPAKRAAPVHECFTRQRHGRRRRGHGQSPQGFVGAEVFELVLT